MPYRRLMLVFALIFAWPRTGLAQLNLLDDINSVWVAVQPVGMHLSFYALSLGQIEASLPMGQAILQISDGDGGSNLKVSGAGFNCFYLVTLITADEMVWELKKGDAVCFASAHLKKVIRPQQDKINGDRHGESALPPKPLEKQPSSDGMLNSGTSSVMIPREAVVLFYHFLGRGDGVSANRLIVPWKQNNKNFLPSSMTTYYSKLTRGLRILDITDIGNQSFRVKYDYQNGKKYCDGVSIVTTRMVDSFPRIETIRALNGC